MIVELRTPTRTVELDGPMAVTALLARLGIPRETVLVIRDGTLVPGAAMLEASDRVEVRSVISGGAR